MYFGSQIQIFFLYIQTFSHIHSDFVSDQVGRSATLLVLSRVDYMYFGIFRAQSVSYPINSHCFA